MSLQNLFTFVSRYVIIDINSNNNLGDNMSTEVNDNIVTSKDVFVTGAFGFLFGGGVGLVPSIGLWYWLTKRGTPQNKKTIIWFVSGLAWLFFLTSLGRTAPSRQVAAVQAKQNLTKTVTGPNCVATATPADFDEAVRYAVSKDGAALNSMITQGRAIVIGEGVEIKRVHDGSTWTVSKVQVVGTTVHVYVARECVKTVDK